MIEQTITNPDIGSIFLGIGGMIVLLVIAYLIYAIADAFNRWLRKDAQIEEAYGDVEEASVIRYAKKKGIDILKFRRMMEMAAKKKSFRKRLEQEVINDTFGKEKEE